MIKAEMYWSMLRLEVHGHAGYAAPGQDIVCAGASMLTDALAGVLTDAERRGRVTAQCTATNGEIMIKADPYMDALNEIKAYFRMCVKGLRMLHEAFPKHVEIKEVD